MTVTNEMIDAALRAYTTYVIESTDDAREAWRAAIAAALLTQRTALINELQRLERHGVRL